MNHLDDDAELYALGMTEPGRGAEIEAHLAECAPCRDRVVAAESAAASLAATLPPMPAAAPRRVWPALLATAAALLFAATAAVEGFAVHAAGEERARTGVALGAIAASHFGHTTLAADAGIIAKALYARDGAWCYVVATGAPRDAHVVIRRGAVARDAGPLDAGSPATLFVTGAGRADEITLVAGGRTVAHGAPVY